MMANLSRNAVLLFLLFFIVVVLQFQIAVQQGGAGHPVVQDEQGYPLLHKYVLDTVSLLKKSHKSSWEKVKSVIHDLQMKFSPPNLDFRGAKEAQSDGMKEAAEKSFHKSKETVKESAKSAAEMIGDAVHKTAQKVKAPSSASASERESDSEL
ncbi:uncharacterized protein LOC114720924 [Neltuma alba]|uniref:uncharacterized protein LOC114714500 n=1 Tax=Neltuma alba TaxID=207710 RepID=UPI0010A598CF|nr:uncharacterized protein LOC114714500 [Prosopis alba]XP_028762503.1 uncharacterized protein LOC114720924 [Prosopis alba]